MSWGTLERTLRWIDNGDIQSCNPLHLHLFGEPMLDIDFERKATRIKRSVPHISFSTNGSNMNMERAERLADVGFDWITLSPHDPQRTISAYFVLKAKNNHVIMHGGPDHSWAGQITHDVLWRGECEYQRDQKAVVRWNGDVAVCCISDGPEAVIGSVWDNDLPEKDLPAISICEKCHLERKETYGSETVPIRQATMPRYA